jgi:hypothetical protein
VTAAVLLLASALAQIETPVASVQRQSPVSSRVEELAMDNQTNPGDECTLSAMVAEPPSPAKLELIRRYLRLTGTQQRIDSGSFLQPIAVPGGPLSQPMVELQPDVSFRDMFTIPMAALLRAYQPHRHVWQEEYERHVNWEYGEDELRQIVAFLGSGAGQHFLEGERRMNAYVGTNTEELLEQIVSEAQAILRSPDR